MALFQIITAKHGERCHLLFVNAQLPGVDVAAAVEVRVNFGDEEPYTFTKCAYDCGARLELITREEYCARCEAAEMHDQEYEIDGQAVIISPNDDYSMAASAACDQAITKFKALIALDVFSLPVTF